MCANRPILQLTTEVQTICITGRIGCLGAQPPSAFGEEGFTSLLSGVVSSSGGCHTPRLLPSGNSRHPMLDGCRIRTLS